MYISHSSTIVSMDIPKGSLTFKLSDKKAKEKVERIIENLLSKLGPQDLWHDPDFGPDENDQSGSHSIYKSGKTAGPGYPNLDEICWKRPNYKAEKEVTNPKDFFCFQAKLFQPANPNKRTEVIQGKLGDAWLLGAFGILASQPNSLKACFWNPDKYKNYGIYICRILKGFTWHYVIIDDKVPVYSCVNGKPCFGRCKDNSELWVPLLEKAYAKLLGSYDSLIGGHLDDALRHLTGSCSETIVLSKSDPEWDPNYDHNINSNMLWQKLKTNASNWATACVIHPDKNSSSIATKSLNGLVMNHAYSLLSLGVVNGVKLVRLHNPWSCSEWTGAWGEESPEREKFNQEIERAFYSREFPLSNDSNDGTFLMEFATFLKTFSVLYVNISPSKDKFAYRTSGSWKGKSSGGNRLKRTWINNPRFYFDVRSSNTKVFIEICRYFDNSQVPFGFCLCPVESNGDMIEVKPEEEIQSDYTFRSSCSTTVSLKKGRYAIVPSQYERDKEGKFYITVISDKSLSVENTHFWGIDGFKNAIRKENMEFDSDDDSTYYNENNGGKIQEHTSAFDYNDDHFFQNHGDESIPDISPQVNDSTASDASNAEKYEEIKEKLVKSARSKGITMRTLSKVFEGKVDTELSRYEFKGRMVELGFNVSELPDSDFSILAGEDGKLSSTEFSNIFKEQLYKEKIYLTKPKKQTDDLIFRPVAHTEGLISLKIVEALDLVDPVTESPTSKQDKLNLTLSLNQKKVEGGYESVYISSPMQISGRNVIIRVWGSKQRPLCYIPIAYDIEDFKEFGLDQCRTIPNSAVFNVGLEEEWKNTYSLNPEPLEGYKVQTEEGFSFPNRREYIEKCLSLAISALDDVSGLNGMRDQDLMEDNYPTSWEPKCKSLFPVISPYEEVKEDQQSSLDRKRERNFLRLKLMSKTRRYETISKMKDGRQSPVENHEVYDRRPWGESRLYLKQSSNVTYENSELETVEDIVKELVFARYEGILDAKKNQIKNASDSLETSDASSHHCIFSGVFSLPGEERVREELLDRSENIRAWFEKFDKDDSGSIDATEFGEALVELGLKITKSELRVLLDRFDTDGDGMIRYEEFFDFMTLNSNSSGKDSPDFVVNNSIDLILSTIVSQNCDLSRINGEPWSIGYSSDRLNSLRQQLKQISKNKDSRKILSEFDCALRISSIFQNSDQMKQFTARSDISIDRSIESGKKICKQVLCQVAGLEGTSAIQTANLDVLLSRLHVKKGDIGPSAESLIARILKEHAHKVIEQELEDNQGYPTNEESEDQENPVSKKLLSFEEEYYQGDGDSGIVLVPKAMQVRMFFDTLGLWKKTSIVSRSNIAQIVESSETMKSLETKLKVLMKDHDSLRSMKYYYLVDMYLLSEGKLDQGADSNEANQTEETKWKQRLQAVLQEFENKKTDKQRSTIRIVVRNPGTEAKAISIDLEDLPISPNDFPRLRNRVQQTLQPYENYSSSSTIQEPIYSFLEKLCKRIVITRKCFTNQGNEVLSLQLAEDQVVVETLRNLFDMCTFSFLVSISNLAITFTVDPELNLSVEDCEIKKHVFESIRNQQNGNILRSLLDIPVTSLCITFQENDSEYCETMAWEEFLAHLSNHRNSFVDVQLKPGHQSYSTPVSKDGGMHPVFAQNLSKFPYSPNSDGSALNGVIRFTRVCFIQQKYIILSVYDTKQANFEVIAYDPKEQAQYNLYKKISKPDGNSENKPFILPKNFDLLDDAAWENSLTSVVLGECLSPRILLLAHMCEGRTVGTAEIPVSVVTNEPGREIDRWITIRKDSNEVGQIHVRLRFDVVTSSSSLNNELLTDASIETADKDSVNLFEVHDNGDEAFAPDDSFDEHIENARESINTSKEYAILAQRLRDELEEKSLKLVESERVRNKLENTCKSHELELRRVRNDLERRQQKLEDAIRLTEKLEPSRPQRNAGRREREQYHQLDEEYKEKLEELENVKIENDRLQKLVRIRGHKVNQEVQELKAKLAESDRKLRIEISEKQNLLLQTEGTSYQAQENATTSLKNSLYQGNIRAMKRHEKKQRDKNLKARERARKQRTKSLKERLGSQFHLYERELHASLLSVYQQLADRCPADPEKSVRGLEKFLYSISDGESNLCIDEFGENLMNYGIKTTHEELEMILTHFDIENNDMLNLDEFFELLNQLVSRNPSDRDRLQIPAGSGWSAARGMNSGNAKLSW